MKEMVTEITVLSFGIPVIAEHEKGYKFTPEELAWMEEMAMKEYLSKPLVERIKNIEETEMSEFWKRKEIAEYATQIEDELITYEEVMDYLDDCNHQVNQENNEDESKSVKKTGQEELIEDDCG